MGELRSLIAKTPEANGEVADELAYAISQKVSHELTRILERRQGEEESRLLIVPSREVSPKR
jgi:hypothetical protein